MRQEDLQSEVQRELREGSFGMERRRYPRGRKSDMRRLAFNLGAFLLVSIGALGGLAVASISAPF